jgi:hypothetical protein
MSPATVESAPLLTARDLESVLYEVATQEHAELVTVFGRGCGSLRIEAGGTSYAVHEVQSELELRALLPPLTAPIAQRMAFVVPWKGKLPSDIAGEFKWSGQPRVIRLRDRVARLFGAHSASAELDQSALPDYLLTHPVGPLPQVVGVLGKRQLWEAFLSVGLGVDTGAGLALDTLLAWAARDGRGPTVLQELTERRADAVRSELLDELRRTLGPLAPVAWQAWERGEGRRLLEYGLLFDVVRGVDDSGVRVWLRMVAAPALGLPVDDRLDSIVSQLGGLSGAALRGLQRSADGAARVRAVLQGAEQLLASVEPELRPHVTKSVWLPSAAECLLAELGGALSSLAGEPSAERFAAARAIFERLAHHRIFDDPAHKGRLERAEMALRLGAWLCAPNHDVYATSQASFADVEALGRWYTEEGGFVDWARRAGRGGASDAFGAGVQAVIARVDMLRRELDLRFARGLAAWLDAGRPAAGVLPIEIAIASLVEPFLAERDERRLLVLLMDGMAWSQAVQLMAGLSGSGWGPLRWRPAAGIASRRGAASGAYPGLYAPVLAALPTLTDVSRAAFFAGARIPSGKAAPPTSDDPTRWASHASAKRFDRTPCLLLRGPGHNPDGSASKLALSRIADAEQRVVSIVINAIDASLKGDTQAHATWHPNDIRSLPELLNAARQAGRSVLLASDHGHVPGDCLTEFVPSPQTGGARWRPLGANNEALNPEFEVRVPASQVWAPPGATAIALLADDRHRYAPQAHAGEHGGATLGEVMAPCVLLGCDGAPELALADDPSLEVRPHYLPEWWLYNLPKAAAQRPAKRSSRPKLSTPPQQLGLAPPRNADPAAKAAPGGPTPAVTTASNEIAVPVLGAGGSTVSEAAWRVTARLLENDAFKLALPPSPSRDRLLRALQYLWDSSGEVDARGLASAVDLPVPRVAGLVSKLAQVVNVDGYGVVRSEPGAGGIATIRFQRDLLCELFEVKP